MDAVLILFALLALAGIVYWSIDTEGTAVAEEDQDQTSTHRGLRLLKELRESPLNAERISRQILAIGPSMIPIVLMQLRNVRAQEDALAANYLGALEHLAGDFGPVAVHPICHELSRLPLGSPVIAHLQRALNRIGPGAIRGILEFTGNVSASNIYLQQVIVRWDAAQLIRALKTISPERITAVLTLTATHFQGSESALLKLWETACADKRLAILNWAMDWAATDVETLILLGLKAHDSTLRRQSATAAHIYKGRDIEQALMDAWTNFPADRLYFMKALVAQRAVESVTRLVNREPLELAQLAYALSLFVSHDPTQLEQTLASVKDRSDILQNLSRGGLTTRDWRVDELIAATERQSDPLQVFYLHALGDFIDFEPRARERLIRLAETNGEPRRATACLVLAVRQDTRANELIIRAIQQSQTQSELLVLRQAAQWGGPSLQAGLLRRLAEQRPMVANTALSIVRSCPSEGWIPPLLGALEDIRSTAEALAVIQTLYTSGELGRQAIQEAFREQRRGLVLPCLRYYVAHGSSTEAELLLNVYDHQLTLRNLSLSILESLGLPAIDAIQAHIDAGGDNYTLEILERRLLILDHCLHYLQYCDRDEDASIV